MAARPDMKIDEGCAGKYFTDVSFAIAGCPSYHPSQGGSRGCLLETGDKKSKREAGTPGANGTYCCSRELEDIIAAQATLKIASNNGMSMGVGFPLMPIRTAA